MLELLAVGAGGFAGAIARYTLSGEVHRRYGGTFPLGTLAVNLLGCLLIGLLASLVETRQLLSPRARLVLMVGFLGSLTTFSTFGYETLALLRQGALVRAAANAAGNLLCGLAAVWLGGAAGRLLGR